MTFRHKNHSCNIVVTSLRFQASLSPSPARSGDKKQRQYQQFMSTADASFNLDKARHEVRQLGIKGLSSESKEDAILNKLIQLGAKVVAYV